MIRTLAAVLTLALATPALAANSQQDRMKDCNKQATGMKGAERKAFMSKCLKGEATMTSAKPGDAKPADTSEAKPAAKTDQQSKMKECNEKAAGKKGEERKAFMKECLSAK